MKRLAALLVCVFLLAGLTAVSAQSQDDGGGKTVTFDIGDPQGIDSMNPLIGVTVAAYEAWNIQYATLTDKAASDFHTIPGLAESWKSSKDKRTWTYKLRDGTRRPSC
jgi:peptide/nickel transport system substrate-binding protein